MNTIAKKWFKYYHSERYLFASLHSERVRLMPIFCEENQCTIEHLESSIDQYIDNLTS